MMKVKTKFMEMAENLGDEIHGFVNRGLSKVLMKAGRLSKIEPDDLWQVEVANDAIGVLENMTDFIDEQAGEISEIKWFACSNNEKLGELERKIDVLDGTYTLLRMQVEELKKQNEKILEILNKDEKE